MLNFVTVLCWEAQRASQRPTAECGPRPASARRAPPRPGRNLGLGPKSGPVADTPWASYGPKLRASLRAVGLNPTVLRRFRPGKTGVAGQLPQTLNHFSSPLLSAHRAAAAKAAEGAPRHRGPPPPLPARRQGWPTRHGRAMAARRPGPCLFFPFSPFSLPNGGGGPSDDLRCARRRWWPALTAAPPGDARQPRAVLSSSPPLSFSSTERRWPLAAGEEAW